jgi:hypothetical protein
VRGALTAAFALLTLISGCEPEPRAGDSKADLKQEAAPAPAPRPAAPSARGDSEPEPEPAARPWAERPCELLSEADAAKILGSEELKVMRPMKGMCSYRSGTFEVTIGYVEDDESPEQAAAAFAEAHADPPRDGERWEPVAGVGDEAVYDPTVHSGALPDGRTVETPANTLDVRVGGLRFRVTARTSADDRGANREATMAAARAVLATLSSAAP